MIGAQARCRRDRQGERRSDAYPGLGLTSLNNRHYNPTLGVFVSVDPLVTTTMQPYIYGAANPVTYSDPSGLEPCPQSGCSHTDSGGRRPCADITSPNCGASGRAATEKYIDWSFNYERSLPNYWASVEEAAARQTKSFIRWGSVGASLFCGGPLCVGVTLAGGEWLAGASGGEHGVGTDEAVAGRTGYGATRVGGWLGRWWAGRGSAPAASLTDDLFHYTKSEFAESITGSGLRPGSYVSPNGQMGPLQAHLDLALPPNSGLRDLVIRVDAAGLRSAGYTIPEATQVTNIVVGANGRV